MQIATWNINSVRARLQLLRDWLQAHQPDVLLLQETKVEDALFPFEPLEDQGYNVEVFGEPTYNGVAVLARWDIDDVFRGLPGDGPDAERRVLGCEVRGYKLLNVYVPNGQAVGSVRYAEKLAWLARLRALLDARYGPADKVVVAGDFNITFDDRDLWNPEGMREAIHCSTPERQALARVMDFGLVDALRQFHGEAGIYTWWDYRSGGWQRRRGMRIDHLLLTPPTAARCTGVEVDLAARSAGNASDHAPVIATFTADP